MNDEDDSFAAASDRDRKSLQKTLEQSQTSDN